MAEEARAVRWFELLRRSRGAPTGGDGAFSLSPAEHRTITADVKRTRASLPDFKTESVRQLVAQQLVQYCERNRVQYKQGLNEILAPLVATFLPRFRDAPAETSEQLYVCLDGLVSKFVRNLYNDSDFVALQCSFRLFRHLLLFHDPVLGAYLDRCDLGPELYATPWFLTLFARDLELDLVFILWDILLTDGSPSLVFFMSLALLLAPGTRDRLRQTELSSLPETVSRLGFADEGAIRMAHALAIKLRASTPGSFVAELECVVVAPQTPSPELLLQLEDVPCLWASGRQVMSLLRKRKEGSKDLVAVDIRSEAERDGPGGYLSVSWRVDPHIVHLPDHVERWLQHLDELKGCNICIIDTPPRERATGKTLWRRLILGEGDGEADEGLPGGEGAVLATMLQQRGFPFVSVVAGGFPALHDAVADEAEDPRQLEPVVIGHEASQCPHCRPAPASAQPQDEQPPQPRPRAGSRVGGLLAGLTIHSHGSRAAAAAPKGALSQLPREEVEETLRLAQQRRHKHVAQALSAFLQVQLLDPVVLLPPSPSSSASAPAPLTLDEQVRVLEGAQKREHVVTAYVLTDLIRERAALSGESPRWLGAAERAIEGVDSWFANVVAAQPVGPSE